MGTLNKDKAAAWLMSHAGTASRHECAKYVREALEAGGLNTTGRPTQAKDYGPFLQTSGFSKISTQGYFPQKGDVVVIQNYPVGNPAGHIAFYTGTQWVSDYRQPDMIPGSFYRKAAPPMQVYRP